MDVWSRMGSLKITVGHKIILIIMILAGPFGLMTKLYLDQVGKDIAFASKEIDGARYIETLWPVLADAVEPAGPKLDALKRRA